MAVTSDLSGATEAPLSRRTLFGIAAAVWLSFGLVQCAQSYIYAQATGRAWTMGNALITAMPWWLSWLVLTPVIERLATRYSFTDGRHWRSFIAHASAGAVVSCVHLFIAGSAYWLTTGQHAGVATSWANQLQRYFGNFFLEAVVTYAGAAGAFIAINFARAARDERVRRAQLEAQAAALEASVTQARLDALAMELNPHFLFNTLSAISGLVAHGRGTEAQEVVRRLGVLLRRTLDRGPGPFTSVAHEIELLEDYLFIQRTRFSDRLLVGVDIDQRARDCLIPSMLLQPLVENAIRHGVEPGAGPGEVSIVVRRAADSLRIVIADSGAGFQFDGAGRLAHEGVGISNTRARLAHLFGTRASLTLANRHGGGSEATVVLPAAEQDRLAEGPLT